jgi:hypothetical protein
VAASTIQRPPVFVSATRPFGPYMRAVNPVDGDCGKSATSGRPASCHPQVSNGSGLSPPNLDRFVVIPSPGKRTGCVVTVPKVMPEMTSRPASPCASDAKAAFSSPGRNMPIAWNGAASHPSMKSVGCQPTAPSNRLLEPAS